MAPPKLTPRLQSLPPILHIRNLDPIPSCSKAPRGLFVQSRVTRIFTGIAISPSPSLRQRPSCYTIRAGQNLPDKGFRYLRTVIVTAAVHWGFSSKLRDGKPSLTSPLNLPALGRYQPLYFLLRVSRDLCFCLTVAWAHSLRPGRTGDPFSQSYGVILPSSLTRVLSFTLGFSPHLPVSDCGTDTHYKHVAFLDSIGSTESPWVAPQLPPLFTLPKKG